MPMEMELPPVGVGEEKRRRREEEGEVPGHLGSFGFVLGSGSAALSPPQKLFRTDASPFRSSSSSSSGPTSSYDCCGGSYDAARPLHTPLKSPGDMAPGVCPTPLRGISFTSVQWQELHRQALIYKHIMSAVPVPPDLLLPIPARSSYPGASPHLLPPHLVGRGGGGFFNLRFTNSTDAEPGRCRRTDGKKWRCSRDVAPDQKYCERHMHRGRPRSRKHVEPPKIKATPKICTTTITTPATKASTATATAVTLPEGFPAGSSLKFPFQSMESSKEPRYTDWMKKDTGEMASAHQWELMNCNLGAMRSNTAPIVKGYEDQLDLNNYTNLHDHCCPFLSPDLSSLEEDAITGAAHREPPRSFIDAWSTETPTSVPLSSPQGKPCSVSDGGKLPPSTLTLSLPSGIERDTDQIEMGLGLSDSMARSQTALSWMAPVSPVGGPLAEVLRSSTATSPPNGRSSAGSSSCDAGLVNLVIKGFYGSHEVSPQDSPKRLAASSPSGVLQKALASLSDSSSSGSPTFAAAAAAAAGSEIGRQWWSQNK